jgi:menaquinone-dependent protoporphyrinogen oxidase
MTRPLLVAYATKKGSTRVVAADVAATLKQQGIAAELEPAARVRDLGRYGGVVLGGALYMGRWHRDARQFMQRHRGVLAGLPFAVFAMGPSSTDEEALAESRRELERALAKTAELEPLSVAVFGGVIEPKNLHFPFSRMPRSDARDWDAIRAWAQEIGALLAERAD